MDYAPKHPQPFTFAQACELEIPTITKEISRLENSLFHLNRTQLELREHLTGLPEEDRQVADIIKENEDVINSQKERIAMLKLALEEQGINTRSGHYDSTATQRSIEPVASLRTQDQAVNGAQGPPPQEDSGQRDDGIFL